LDPAFAGTLSINSINKEIDEKERRKL